MPKVPISEQGASALDALGIALKQRSDDIVGAGKTLRSVVESNQDGLGVFAEQILTAVDQVSQKQKNSTDTIETLSTRLTSLAASIREIAAML